ncbi:MAG: bifunctional homocysteine S-methyltransferase/methylenetetrahydrofolate reductase [Candidatus Zhuqueibacterota bacterium]
MKTTFRERLAQNDVLVCDGAMGTMLYDRGIFINRCFDELNITTPKMVRDIHRLYVDSGADIIETNTFGANRFKLAPHGLETKLYKINYIGARIAREIASNQVLVAGSIGPLGLSIEPLGPVSSADAFNAYVEQALPLCEGDVDLILLETFSDVVMIHIAIKAVRSLTDKPIIASMSFTEGQETVYGMSPANVAQALDAEDIDVIGVNCSTGPQPILEAIQQMIPHSRKKFSAMPNAGAPRMIDGRLFYMSSPEYFAEYAKRFIQSGVSIVGGCCGTTPDHIRAIKAAVKALQPARTVEPVIVPKVTLPKHEHKATRQLSPLAQKLTAHNFITCIEMTPPRSTDVSKAIAGAEMIKAAGVDAVNIPDGPRASARISPLALAVLIEKQVGIDTILHYTCRDRNILGMQSDLLGAAALGLKNILIVTGDPPKLGDYPTATAVFNVDSIGLMHIANNLNQSLDIVGNPLGAGTSFYLGVGANPGAINYKEEMDRLRQKVEAGAEFVLTQPIFDHDKFLQFLDDAAVHGIPIVGGILPLASFRNAEFLHNEVPGMSIPLNLRSRMQNAKDSDDARNIGIEIAREMLLQIKDLVRGVYLMPPFGRYDTALKVLEVL